jgi:Uncharacterised protein family (UPF0175)
MSNTSLTPYSPPDGRGAQTLVAPEKVAFATALFKDGSLSLTRSAKVAGMPLPAFMRHLSRSNVPVIQSNAHEVKKDVETLEAWLALASPKRVSQRSRRARTSMRMSNER